jgi:lipoprotein-releasing system permease protein
MASYEWLIGTRYLRSTHRRGFISFVAIVSVLGLALGVATLITVLSVMNGFEREIRTRILSVTSHATLMGIEGNLPDWQDVRAKVLKYPGVDAASPYIEEQAMLANGARGANGASITAATVRGIVPEEERTSTGLAQRVTQGKFSDLQAGEYNTILGVALAKELNVKVGGSVVLIAPDGIATPVGVVPSTRRFNVVGIVESGIYEIDRNLALIQMTDAARLFRLGDRVTGIRLALQDPFQAPTTVRKIARSLGGNGFYVRDWTTDHEIFFRSIESMKKMMFIILFMIVAVAAFNIVATLVMIVKEKQTDIAILRTLGAGPPNILLTFIVQGVLIGLGGTVLGALLGKVLSDHLGSIVGALERVLDTQFIDARVYYISDLPTYVEGADVLQICGVAFVLCALATVYPAWRAARTAPAQALRHE